MASTINASTTAGLVSTADTSGVLALQTNSGTTAVTIDTSQNVGIGTTSPAKKLDVVTTATDDGVQVTGGATGANLFLNNTGTSGRKYRIYSTGSSNAVGAGFLGFYDETASSFRMGIDPSGNFLVGQTAQTGTEKFGVTQSATGSNAARFYASSTSFVNNIVEISCARSGATTEYNAFTVFDNNTTLKMLIRPNGNLLNANNSYGSLSDVSLKENIINATPKLDGLMQVKVRNYNLKDDVNKTKQIGVIAQELETVFPSMIEEDKDGIKSVKYSVFVPMLIKSIQELKAINDQQAETINTLTARVVALEGK